MLWQASSRARISNPLGNVGALTLIFLLVETSLALDAPSHYVSSLLSGAGIGMVLALLSIAVVKKISPKYEVLISLGQVYLAYWAALAIGASAMAAALFCVVIFTEFYQRRLDIKVPLMSPVLLDDRPTYFVALGLFIFTAWQSHQSATLILGVEAVMGLCIGLLVAFLGQRMGIPRFESLGTAWYSALKLGLFLLGTMILWPHEPEIESLIVWIALGSAVLLPILAKILLAALHDIATRSDQDPTNGF
jgi:hypothetical protein